MFENLVGQQVALHWSGGMDSTLLLAMLRESGIDFTIVQFRQFWTKEQTKKVDKLIRDWDLKVFSYPASQVSFVGQDDEISAVFEIPVGNGTAPLVTDLIDGDRCIESLAETQMHIAPFQFDINIVGSRKDDKHYSLPQVVPAERWQQNGTEFYAPLYEKSREWVKRELRARGLDDSEVSDAKNSGNLSCCSLCIRPNETGFVRCPKKGIEIPVVQWSPEYNLAQFRQAYS